MFENNKAVNTCCKDPKNHDSYTMKDMTIRVCRICLRRHFEADAAPGKIGLTGKGLG